MRRTPAIAAVVVAGLLSLTACSQAKDAAENAANDAACSVARAAVDEAADQAGQAIDDIGADPQAAKSELQNIRDALATAEKGVDGDVKTKVGEAKAAVEKLLGQAEDAARGTKVDTSAVSDARAQLDTAVDDVKNLC